MVSPRTLVSSTRSYSRHCSLEGTWNPSSVPLLRDSEDHSKSAGYKGLTDILKNYTTRAVQNATQESELAKTKSNPTLNNVVIKHLPILIILHMENRIYCNRKMKVWSLGRKFKFWSPYFVLPFNILTSGYCHVSGVPWLIITGSGLDDWIYWHLYSNYS
jgi:hypothetical protein